MEKIFKYKEGIKLYKKIRFKGDISFSSNPGRLNLSEEKLQTWDSIYKYDLIDGEIKVIEKGEPLFIRLDKDEELEYIKEGMKNG